MAAQVEHLAEGITLHRGDCRDVMASLSSDSIDMIWTDPPYGHSNHDGDFNARLNDHRNIENKPIASDDGEEMRLVVDGMLKEAVRVLKLTSVVCCCCGGGGGGPKPTFAWIAQRMDRDGLTFFHSVIWDKVNPGLGWRYRRQHEMVMVAHCVGGKLLWANNDIAVSNIYQQMPGRNRQHPNEKPQNLVSYFLNVHAIKGQTILDPFMGSGVTGAACVDLGMKFIGIELDQGHFDTACRRISKTISSQSLFVDKPEGVGSVELF